MALDANDDSLLALARELMRRITKTLLRESSEIATEFGMETADELWDLLEHTALSESRRDILRRVLVEYQRTLRGELVLHAVSLAKHGDEATALGVLNLSKKTE